MPTYYYYVNAKDTTYIDWTQIGTTPFLDLIDYPTNYVTTPANLTNGKSGIYNFVDSGAENSETIDRVEVQIYCLGIEDPDIGLPSIRFYYWDGSSWNYLYASLSTSWGWKAWVITSKIDTWAKVDGFKIYLIGTVRELQSIYVDCVRLKVNTVIVAKKPIMDGLVFVD